MMQTHKKHLILLLAMMLVVLLSACSTVGGSSQTAQQVLQNSLNAMKQLKSTHVETKSASTINYGTSNSTSTSSTQKPLTINVTASGDEVLPDKASLHVSLGQGVGNGFSLSEIILGKQLYIQNAKGQWYSLDTSKFKGSSGNSLAQSNPANYNKLLTIAQKATYVDHGTQTLNGQSLRHITVTFDKNALKDLLNATGQQEKTNALLNNVKLINPTLDLWIDESTSYVHHMELKFGMNINMSSLQSSGSSTPTSTSTPANITTNFDTIIDFSKFNEAITINAPSNAIPTSNPFSIFGSSQS